MIIGADGEIGAHVESGFTTTREMATWISASVSASQSMARNLWNEELSTLFVELEDAVIMLVPLSSDAILAVVARPTSNIGRIRYEVKKHRDEILSAV